MLTATVGERVRWSYRHHLNSTSVTTITKKGVVTKVGRKLVYVLFDGNKAAKPIHLTQLKPDLTGATQMEQKQPLSLKLTKNATWGFVTECGTRQNVSFDKSGEFAIKGMLREVIKMAYHAYGVKDAQAMIHEYTQHNDEYYKELNP